VAAALRKTAVPFGVSTLAQDAAVASLDAEHELAERVDRLVAERARVVAALAAQGWPPLDAQANFVWLRLGERTEELAEACAAAGVVVRPFPGEGVRVTVAEAEASDLFLEVAARFAPRTA
jgi:histidinol-phosphate aminotransferase